MRKEPQAPLDSERVYQAFVTVSQQDLLGVKGILSHNRPAMDKLRLLAIGLAFFAALAAGESIADQDDPRLDSLFGHLKEASDPQEARFIEGLIWGIWSQHDDDAIVALMRNGEAAMVRNDYTGAIRAFDQVIAIAPEYAEGWNKRATVRYLIGDYRASLADIAETLAREPRHFGALSGRGLVYSALERPEDALESFEAALKVNPQMIGPRVNVEALRKHLREQKI